MSILKVTFGRSYCFSTRNGCCTILGLFAFYHDSGVALLEDDNIIAAVQEERFSRKKHDESFPVNSIKYCLQEGKISLNDIA
jgi:carbamoyltransferase